MKQSIKFLIIYFVSYTFVQLPSAKQFVFVNKEITPISVMPNETAEVILFGFKNDTYYYCHFLHHLKLLKTDIKPISKESFSFQEYDTHLLHIKTLQKNSVIYQVSVYVNNLSQTSALSAVHCINKPAVVLQVELPVKTPGLQSFESMSNDSSKFSNSYQSSGLEKILDELEAEVEQYRTLVVRTSVGHSIELLGELEQKFINYEATFKQHPELIEKFNLIKAKYNELIIMDLSLTNLTHPTNSNDMKHKNKRKRSAKKNVNAETVQSTLNTLIASKKRIVNTTKNLLERTNSTDSEYLSFMKEVVAALKNLFIEVDKLYKEAKNLSDHNLHTSITDLMKEINRYHSFYQDHIPSSDFPKECLLVKKKIPKNRASQTFAKITSSKDNAKKRLSYLFEDKKKSET